MTGTSTEHTKLHFHPDLVPPDISMPVNTVQCLQTFTGRPILTWVVPQQAGALPHPRPGASTPMRSSGLTRAPTPTRSSPAPGPCRGLGPGDRTGRQTRRTDSVSSFPHLCTTFPLPLVVTCHVSRSQRLQDLGPLTLTKPKPVVLEGGQTTQSRWPKGVPQHKSGEVLVALTRFTIRSV